MSKIRKREQKQSQLEEKAGEKKEYAKLRAKRQEEEKKNVKCDRVE
jgi:hypothetical protein